MESVAAGKAEKIWDDLEKSQFCNFNRPECIENAEAV